MSFIFKQKAKRVQTERGKKLSVRNGASPIKTRPLTNILLSILAIVLAMWFLSLGTRFTELSSLVMAVLMTAGLIFILGYYLIYLEPTLFSSFIRILSFTLLGVAPFALVALFADLGWSLYLMPMTLFAMIIAVAYSRTLAIITFFFQLFILWVWGNPSFAPLMVHAPAVLIVSLFLTELRTRAKVIRIGLGAGIAFLIMICARGIFDHPNLAFVTLWKSVRYDATYGLFNGFFSGFILLGILPFLERWFGVMTNLSLLELADLNQPLLKRLSLEAPGTYHHSLRVGDLAEAAAEAIGADTMLTRVGAYYHDIGKLAKPEYFGENEISGESKHKDLSPTMSTLIITAHVKDGLEMARDARLPKRIQDFVVQHHGTSVMKYFYSEAMEQGNVIAAPEASPKADNDKSNGAGMTPEDFRYPGPRPQSREVALVMLADGSEAFSRTLTSVSPAKLKGVVHQIIMDHLLDGQFDQCSITLADLKKIEETFIRVLAGMYHARIKYPDKETAV